MAMQMKGRTRNGKVRGPWEGDARWAQHHLMVLNLMAIRVLNMNQEPRFEYQTMYGANLANTRDFSGPAADLLEMVEQASGKDFGTDISSNHGRLAAVQFLLSELSQRPRKLNYGLIRLDGFSSQVARILANYVEPGVSHGIWTVGETAEIKWLLEEAAQTARDVYDHIEAHDMALLDEALTLFTTLADNGGYAIRGQ
jgi:hypothetical protein